MDMIAFCNDGHVDVDGDNDDDDDDNLNNNDDAVSSILPEPYITGVCTKRATFFS